MNIRTIRICSRIGVVLTFSAIGVRPALAQAPAPHPGLPAADLATNASRDYLEGVLEEEMDGDLQSALKTYSSTVKEYDLQRPTIARLVFTYGESLRTAGAYDEAKAQYRRLVREFSDLQNTAERAQQRLAEMSASVPGGISTSRELGVSSGESASNPKVRELLTRELGLVQRQIAMVEKQVETGVAVGNDLLPLKRDALRIQQRLAAASTVAGRVTGSDRADQADPARTAIQVKAPDRVAAWQKAWLIHNKSIDGLQARLLAAEAERDRVKSMVLLVDNTKSPEAFPLDILSDSRYTKLKAEYESAVLKRSDGDENERNKALQSARDRIGRWLKEIYAPELRTSMQATNEEVSRLRLELEAANSEKGVQAEEQPRGYGVKR